MSSSPAIAPDRRRPHPMARMLRRSWGVWFLLPAAAFLLFSIVVPAIQGTVYAFTDWNGLSADWNWVGLGNFVDMFSDPLAQAAIRNTFLLTFVTMVGQNVIGLTLALALSSRIKAKGLFRVIVFAPAVITPVVIANLWRFILMPDGPFNEALRAVGLGGLTQTWLGDPDFAVLSISFVILWQMSGVVMVIYIAGLQNVPDELLEAAAIDGAGALRRFTAVTLPALRPAFVVSTLLCIVGGLKTFDQVWVMTRGGPGVSSHTLSTALYQTAFIRGDFSYSVALAVVLTVFTIIAALIQQRIARVGRDA